MEKTRNIIDRAACMVVAGALGTVGFFFMVLGLTFLPVVGIVIAVPIMSMAFVFLKHDIEVSTVDEASIVCEQSESWCPWPPVGRHTVSLMHR